MKRILLTAAALTLGTSALAWAPADHAVAGAEEHAAIHAAAWNAKPAADGWLDKGMATATRHGMSGLAATAALATWQQDGKPVMADADMAKPQLASLDDGWAKGKPEGGAMTTASMDMKPSGGMEMETGMGGPLEEMATGYPACEPGRGDDRCIQLYERGVRQSLAQWKASEDVAMGGPFEPAPDGKPAADAQQDAAGHGSHAGHGTPPKEASAEGKPVVPEAEPGNAADKPGAMGGPYEPVTGYPPCRPGRGDDRCIQLYERGVTGRMDD